MLVAEKSYYGTYGQYGSYDYKQNAKTDNDNEKKKIIKQKKQKKLKRLYKTVFLGSLLAVFSFVIVLRFAMITQLTNSIYNQKKDLINLEKANSQLRVELTVDLNKVEEEAKTKLGMTKPCKYQLVYLDMNNENKSSVTESKDETSFKYQISEKASKIISYLY